MKYSEMKYREALRTKKNDPTNFSIGAKRSQERTGQLKKKCVGCNHVFPFHRNGESPCAVRNCICQNWIDPDPSIPNYQVNFSKMKE